MTPAADRGTVLVVDDDVALRETLVEGLSDAGFSAHGAENGIEAFDWISRHARPDAVLLDLSMPGMNGWEFLEELGDDPGLSQIPVVVLTAHSEARLAAAADAFLVKPTALQAVIQAIDEEVQAAREVATDVEDETGAKGDAA